MSPFEAETNSEKAATDSQTEPKQPKEQESQGPNQEQSQPKDSESSQHTERKAQPPPKVEADRARFSPFSRKSDTTSSKPKSTPKPAPKSSTTKKPLSYSQREKARQIINMSRNKQNSDLLVQNPMPSHIHTILSLVLCLGLIFVAFLAYISPIFSTYLVTIRPIQVMESLTIDDLGLESLPTMLVSYFVCKFFYYGYISVIGLALFFTMLILLNRGSKMHKQTNAVMYSVLTMLLIATLIGFNYINIVNTVSAETEIITYQFVFFIIGVLIMLAKFAIDAIFGKKLIDNELKTSSVSILTSFTQSFLTLASLAFPLYIFPGTEYRMRGIDILLGKYDKLSFLPMTPIYKSMLMVFTIVTAVCMVINMVFYLTNKKLFLHFNRFSHLFSLFAMIIYGLMGLNYFIVYIDAAAYNEAFNTSMNTYSYVPAALLALFWLGCGFSNLALARVNVQYKIIASPDEDKKEDEKNEKDEKNQKDAVDPFKDQANAPKAGDLKEEDAVPDPIPAFSELDNKIPRFEAEYQKRVAKTFEDVTLPKLVHHIIEYAKYSRERLSYGPVEVKTFLAGIAASRLSILQGMSGTGKTSLPKIFMESIDGTCEIVAVESSWRDKNELLGYYNEFNKKYTPKSFTQFLYKASLNREVPCFIVLDEMNLSRIEYYFSDFLSLMESREHMRHIKLFDVQLFPKIDQRKEYTSLRDGHTIDIPTNVWFIGTANRDESTFEISDKVYDRAQTMNFDKRASKVNVTEDVAYPQKFVSYSQLRKLFDATRTIKFDAESYNAIKQVELLLKPYKISFGNRVLKQIEEFVKAYVACSEIASDSDKEKFTHEAVDCIIFSKVVRKLEIKQITDFDTLIEGFMAAKLPKCVEFVQSLAETT